VEDFDGIIIFVRTRGATTEVTEKLIARGHACGAINGDMNQSMRERMISQLKKGSIDILVATDVAARGLDVDRISHVINYDIPYDSEAYVHRIGRTGRAGRQGKAILFVSHREQRMLRIIENATGKAIDRMAFPSSAEIAAQRRERFKENLVAAMAETPQPFFNTLIKELCDELSCAPEQIAATLAFQLQKERPLEVADPAPDRKKRDRKEKPESKAKGSPSPSPKTNEAPKEDAAPRKRRPAPASGGIAMQEYRLEVGAEHDVTPRDIVGAIANEADVDSSYIGHIYIEESYSTVELPEGMPEEIFQHLRRVRIRNHPMKISLVGDAPALAVPEKPRRKSPAKTNGPSRAKKHATKRKTKAGKPARK
jgi:ATP-dependent RNA helicase DeaD